MKAPRKKRSDPLKALKGSVRRFDAPFTPVVDLDDTADRAFMMLLAEISDDWRLSDAEVIALLGSMPFPPLSVEQRERILELTRLHYYLGILYGPRMCREWIRRRMPLFDERSLIETATVDPTAARYAIGRVLSVINGDFS
ncbi:hypothetical protein [Halomonas sp. M4R1S46]|uniref:hypothetical protein n=1 Tax=Halomonas sp. M4R1S46 TaxID=2982692 RepID=UPI0021E4B02D|nr:hypothetical protein [Halomonas sp. M4R1S46]UYG06857.1 hypothetical protein OCT48_14675 [Halomonas sp. M4R1S46]